MVDGCVKSVVSCLEVHSSRLSGLNTMEPGHSSMLTGLNTKGIQNLDKTNKFTCYHGLFNLEMASFGNGTLLVHGLMMDFSGVVKGKAQSYVIVMIMNCKRKEQCDMDSWPYQWLHQIQLLCF